jgi:PAS domain S-box-containing protein
MVDTVHRQAAGVPEHMAAAVLAQVLEHSPDGVLIIDTNEHYLVFSPGVERMTGLAAEDCLGRHMLDVFPALKDSKVHTSIKRALGGEVVRLDDRPQPGVPLHAARWFSMVFAPLKAADGGVQGAIVTFSEITTRKRAERELADRENRLRTLLYLEPECVKLVAEDGTVIEMNPAGLAMVEANGLADVVAQNVLSLVAAPHREAYLDLNRRVFSGRTGTLEFEIVGLKGGRRWVETHGNPLLNDEGRIVAGLYITRDVTERRRSEQELRDAKARTSRALAAAGMAIWEIDLETGEPIWAENLEAVLGHPVQEYSGVTGGLQRVYEEDRGEVERAMQRAMATGADFNLEYRVNWPDGSLHWVSSAGRVAPSGDGRPMRLLGITTDVTARRSLEAQLRQSQKMEAIGRLAGGIAHDFNNLLTVIHGYSQLLATTCAEDQKADLQEVINAAERAAALTRQLLAFSRRQLLQAKVLDLNTVVPDLSAMLQRLIGEQLELVADLADHLGMVRADRVQLEQVIMNLVVNARDAMPAGGRIVIATSNADLPDAREAHGVVASAGRYVRLSVADTGEGMTDDVKARIFEPFFSTKKRKDAAGLGLSTVYGIVVQSGGHLRVLSAAGQGTTFEVWLPRVDEPRPAIESVPPDAAAAAGCAVILVAEDEAAVRRLARRILESAGYRVLEAGDPAEAEVVFAQYGDDISLLLTDIVMPGGTGPALFMRLKQQKPSLRAVCMSAYAEESVLFDRGEFGSAAFVQKPFSAPALLRVVQRVLEGD